MAAVPAVHGAWVYHEYGPVKDVLKFEEIAVPEVKPDQVLIQVKAVGINPVDNKRRTGYVSADSPFPVQALSSLVSVLPIGQLCGIGGRDESKSLVLILYLISKSLILCFLLDLIDSRMDFRHFTFFGC